MRSTRMKVLVLVALLGIWALIFFGWRRSADPPTTRTAPAPTASRAARAPGAPAGTISRLKTDLANLPRAPYPADVQNVFTAPLPPPPPPPPGPAARPGPPPPPVDPFQEEARQFRYIGFLQSGKVSTAFLVQGQEVHTVPVGELVGGRFRVVEVREDFVLLAPPGGGQPIRLSLGGEGAAGARGPTVSGAPGRPGMPGVPGLPQ
jgi:hypothetical protein